MLLPVPTFLFFSNSRRCLTKIGPNQQWNYKIYQLNSLSNLRSQKDGPKGIITRKEKFMLHNVLVSRRKECVWGGMHHSSSSGTLALYQHLTSKIILRHHYTPWSFQITWDTTCLPNCTVWTTMPDPWKRNQSMWHISCLSCFPCHAH
jgi:hypothetical protein